MSNRAKPVEKRPRDGRGVPLLTRLEVATALGCSRQYVQKLERQGELEALKSDGVHYFTRAELDRLHAKRSKGNAVAFRAFEAGHDCIRVVTEHDLDPERVAHLHAQWMRLHNRIAVDAPHSPVQWQAVYKLRLAKLTPAKLLKALEIVQSDPELRAQLEEVA